VGVHGGEADTAVVHLASEDLVSEEVVTEDAAVGVGVVEGLSDGDVGEVSKEHVHGVVLLLHVVEMTGVLVNAVVTEHVLEEEEGIVVGILDGGGVIEDSDVGVDHLVVSDEEESRDVNGTFLVLDLASGLLGEGLEGSANLGDELVVVEVADTSHNDVVTEVVGGVEVSQVVDSEGLEDISVSLDGLAHHMLSVDVEVSVLNGGLEVAVAAVFVLFSDLLLNDVELVGVEG